MYEDSLIKNTGVKFKSVGVMVNVVPIDVRNYLIEVQRLSDIQIPVTKFLDFRVQFYLQGCAKSRPRGCKCTPFCYTAKPHKLRFFGGYSFNDRQGGASLNGYRGCIVGLYQNWW